MDDKIFNLLNDVKMDEEAYDVRELPESEKAKLKRSFTKKIQKNTRKKYGAWKKIAVVAVVCLAFSGGTLYGKQYLTKKEELASISGAYRIKRDMKDYEMILDKSAKGRDSTVTLDSVLWDGTELVIMVTRTFRQEVELDDSPRLGVDISLDGKVLQSDMAGNSYRVDKSTFKQIMRFGVLDKAQEKKIEAQFSFYDIDDKDEEQWEFKFVIENERFKKDTVRIPIHKNYEVDGEEIEIIEFTRNALGDKILCRKKGEPDALKYWVIKGEDNLGNEVDFSVMDTSSYRGVESTSTTIATRTQTSTVLLYPGMLLLEEGRISKEAKSVTLGLYVGDEVDSNYDGFELVGETFTIDFTE